MQGCLARCATRGRPPFARLPSARSPGPCSLDVWPGSELINMPSSSTAVRFAGSGSPGRRLPNSHRWNRGLPIGEHQHFPRMRRDTLASDRACTTSYRHHARSHHTSPGARVRGAIPWRWQAGWGFDPSRRAMIFPRAIRTCIRPSASGTLRVPAATSAGVKARACIRGGLRNAQLPRVGSGVATYCGFSHGPFLLAGRLVLPDESGLAPMCESYFRRPASIHRSCLPGAYPASTGP